MEQKSQSALAIAMNAYSCLVSDNSAEAITLYTEAITLEPEIRANYGYLGLALLLETREVDAQMSWFSAVDDPEEFDDWVKELDVILNTEAERYSKKSEIVTAWLIRRHLAEISPQNLYNLIELTRLSLTEPLLDLDEHNLVRLIEALQSYSAKLLPSENLALQNLIEQIVVSGLKKKINISIDPVEIQKLDRLQKNRAIIDIATEELKQIVDLIKIYFQKLEPTLRDKSVNDILLKLQDIPLQIAFVYIKFFLSFYPNSRTILIKIITLLQDLHLYIESVEFALQLATEKHQIVDQILGYYAATRGFLSAGLRWREAQATYAKCSDLLQILIQKAESLEFSDVRLIASYGIYTYTLNDTHTAANHPFLGELGAYYQSQIRRLLGNSPLSTSRSSRLANQTKKLRIGYISECLHRHPVGWISRWLLCNHNLEKFDIFVYSLTRTNDDVKIFIKNTVTVFHDLTIDSNTQTAGIKSIAVQIKNDEIDILIELDSLLSPDICAIIALKPAPIQITWLGSDVSGIPAIDYFIADPYVLPDNAESYYSTKIWRLAQTYVAVRGFEVGIPNLRRSTLDIPQDAVIYLSVQDAHKRHPDFIHYQMQILRQVPNSYFLIKSSGVSIDFEEQIKTIASEEGICSKRLRFLPRTQSEEIHRANYAIADVILDTYPYNGATTTLESLWMELPIVTRVGKQFFARNSYTMMVNAGISEGIAWTDTEYVEWGVRLGKDAALRQDIAARLKGSRQTSPLWNGEQFAREMEKAYREMWEIYLQS